MNALAVPSHQRVNRKAFWTAIKRLRKRWKHELGYRRYKVAGHYQQKTEYFKEKRKDAWGKEHYVEIPITTQVWVPDAYHNNAIMDVIYNVYDLETAAVIANVMDRREREYESDTAGMLGRSTNDFIKALIKK